MSQGDEPVSDFSRIVRKQWQEDQLREELEDLKGMLKQKETELMRLQVELKEEKKKRESIEKKATEMINSYKSKIKELEKTVSEKEREIQFAKRTANVLKNALEEERQKGLMQFIKDKMKGKHA